MPTPIVLTGAVLTLTIDGVDRSAQTMSVTLTPSESRADVVFINNNRTNIRNDISWTVDAEMAADWDTTTPGFFEAIWNAAASAPNTALDYVLEANGVTFVGELFPVFPSVGGGATDNQMNSFSFPTTGNPTITA